MDTGQSSKTKSMPSGTFHNAFIASLSKSHHPDLWILSFNVCNTIWSHNDSMLMTSKEHFSILVIDAEILLLLNKKFSLYLYTSALSLGPRCHYLSPELIQYHPTNHSDSTFASIQSISSIEAYWVNGINFPKARLTLCMPLLQSLQCPLLLV